MNEFICIDIGGTAIKYGIIQPDGTPVFTDECDTNAHLGGKKLARLVHDLASRMKNEYPQAKGIAISSAGVVDTEKREIIHASDAIPGYKGINYQAELADLDLPVEIENDVNCAGLSEYATGSARDSQTALIMTIGTGIGGCFIEEGRLWHGRTYSACEVGYIPLDGKPFQDQAATSAMVHNVAKRKGDKESEWNGRRIFAAAKEGDAICQEEIEALARRIGRGIASICFILNPQTVVLGGGIMGQKEILAPMIEESFKEASIPLIADSTQIRYASHQNAAGMQGALIHFLNKHPELNQ